VTVSTGTPARGDSSLGKRRSSSGGAPQPELLKIGELAERAGVSPGTVRHYLREGLLPKPVKTSRNMAYYPADYVERITLIRRLQEERFMPLRVIRTMLDQQPERIRALIEFEDRIVERALASAEERSGGARVSARELRERYEIPQNVLARLVEIGVLTPSSRGYGPDDVQIVEAISRFRAGGYDEALGFTVYDTLRYREALEPLVQEEVRSLLDRLAGEVEVERAHEIIEAGAEPLRELIGAIHSKLLLAELARQRGR
jgi:DNA-binding transcriptional MerR regulator